MRLNEAAARLPGSGIREIMELALRRPDAIRLEIGDPDFDTPPHVAEAAARAAADGATHYASTVGIPPLRVALAEKVLARNGFAVAPEQVVVTQGATQGIFTALAALANRGDEVLVPDPAWPNYLMMTGLLGLDAVRYPLTADTGFLPDVDRLAELVTPRTRVLLVNSPSNPVGTVADRDRIAALAEFAPERVVSAYSFSKTYAMTGWRIGYLAVPAGIAGVVAKCQETVVACVSTPTRHAALAALTGPQDRVAEMRAAYRSRRDLVVALAEEGGLELPTPTGAFYGWVDIGRSHPGAAHEFAVDLLARHGVAVAPGTAFGPAGEGYVRLSPAAAGEDLAEGVRRLALAVTGA
ncbi:pyridoxal phosphate-dependent aminotransferase [Saccharothrix xinjiangensis]|uniref:Aminotransferase n=1 Tax=Saccharothrix xinjiangensis TaxID=204798 RepID=A0ABV9Y0C5_9PSEU